jgi:hypothetical protein
MPIDELARVDIALSDPPLGALSFDIPLIAAQLTSPQVAELDGDTVVEVTPASWRTTMSTLGILAGEQVYEALTLLFSPVVQGFPGGSMPGEHQCAHADWSTDLMSGDAHCCDAQVPKAHWHIPERSHGVEMSGNVVLTRNLDNVSYRLE